MNGKVTCNRDAQHISYPTSHIRSQPGVLCPSVACAASGFPTQPHPALHSYLFILPPRRECCRPSGAGCSSALCFPRAHALGYILPTPLGWGRVPPTHTPSVHIRRLPRLLCFPPRRAEAYLPRFGGRVEGKLPVEGIPVTFSLAWLLHDRPVRCAAGAGPMICDPRSVIPFSEHQWPHRCAEGPGTKDQ
jgi:hypothetical protein